MPSLDRAALAARLPHRGPMCLLDQVLDWAPNRIWCRTWTHRDPANPLRSAGRLHAVCAIEYAAQAMAVHGALQAAAGAVAPRPGMIGAVRDLRLEVARLDAIDGPLEISAEQLLADDAYAVYGFELTGAAQRLVSGRISLALGSA